MPYPSSGTFPSTSLFPGGAPTTAFLTPAGLDHFRELGGDTRADQPTVRTLGAITVARLPLVRLLAVEHARTLGDPVAKGRMILTTVALEHRREFGEFRVYTPPRPPSLDRTGTRALGTIEVNLRVLSAPALVRA